MKLYKIITEYTEGDSSEIITSEEIVTGYDFKSVTEYFLKHCDEYEKDLIQVTYLRNVVQNIPKSDSIGEDDECIK